ncbi:MAG: 2-desacetyl-2-hydroxyethyl bacteriochlorophyllide A dehydrogenase [Candidatus Electronema aureum]|uniref:2-desacetyl-2-hydroxyethyl bacteriochlorophyllide A dehydrogenase n=1 Tax=Candidatus Electronema aureum TaxID=2005002 RepID=A0A521G125_9BACT|nr:MAG: 2-desacetyl-2-hydroxyethyl bacteriochlorophyllide A dehydrogenase [Candidatus Electronema aureum]
MKAAVVHGANDIRVEEYPDPAVGPGEVIVRTKAAGICSKSVRVLLGEALPGKLPLIPGQELAGEISEVGLGVRGFFSGDPVAVYSAGLLGRSVDGAYAEYVRIPKEIVAAGGLVRLDEEISFEDAVMAEPLACTFAAARADRMKEGQHVLIIGGGSVGLMHLKTAKWSGCKVIVVDKNAARLAIAGQMGANYFINSSQSNLYDEVMQITGGRGAEVVIISVLMPEIVADCLRLTAKGGVCNLFSLSPETEAGIDNALLTEREITLTGICAATLGDFRKCLQLIKEEAIIVSDMISHRFTLDSFIEAVEKSKNQELVRGVITFGEMFSLSF